MERRWVVSQKINLETHEIEKLFQLIAENLKPENITYRYDFFYDDCSTRIRDLIEKSIGEDLGYGRLKEKAGICRPSGSLPANMKRYSHGLKVGIDLLMGSPGDKKASFRERMFLPVEMKNGLSELQIRRQGKMIPLLTNPELVLDFDQPVLKGNFFTSPFFVFSVLLIIMIILTGLFREKKANSIIDIIVFSIFSILAILMIFFNFFTDHQQMKWNLNIIWLSPFIILCLISLILSKDWHVWFRIVFFLAAGFLVSLVILPQSINNAFVPLIGILILSKFGKGEFLLESSYNTLFNTTLTLFNSLL